MRLHICCKECNSTIWLNHYAESRFELEKSVGGKIEVTCKGCNKKNEYAIQEIKARSKFVPVIAFVLLCVGFFISFKYLPGISFGINNGVFNYLMLPLGLLISGLIFVVILKSETDLKRNFNKS